MKFPTVTEFSIRFVRNVLKELRQARNNFIESYHLFCLIKLNSLRKIVATCWLISNFSFVGQPNQRFLQPKPTFDLHQISWQPTYTLESRCTLRRGFSKECTSSSFSKFTSIWSYTLQVRFFWGGEWWRPIKNNMSDTIKTLSWKYWFTYSSKFCNLEALVHITLGFWRESSGPLKAFKVSLALVGIFLRVANPQMTIFTLSESYLFMI